MTVPPPTGGPAGLQPERTALAWQRTGITATAAMVPLIVANLRSGSVVLTVVGGGAAVLGALLALGVPRRVDALAGGSRTGSPLRAMLRVAGITTLAAVGGLATAVHQLG